MIYPDVTAAEWAKKHGFSLDGRKCLVCGEPSHGFRPYRTKDYAGCEAAPCVCGCSGVGISTPVSTTARRRWESFMAAWSL